MGDRYRYIGQGKNFYNTRGCESLSCQLQNHCGVPDAGSEYDQENLRYYKENFNCPNVEIVEDED